jgi:hypothetical protein
MVVITRICRREQALIEPALIYPALVSPNQQDRLALRIESKGYSPYLTIPGKPKLLHVGVPGSLQGIDRWSPQIRPKLSQQFGMSQQLILKFFHQGRELSVKGIVKEYYPSHPRIMDLNAYVVNYIFHRHHHL